MIALNTFLKNALLLDAVASAAMALLLLAGAGLLAGLFGLDVGFLRWVGLFLIAYAAFVAWTGRGDQAPRLAVQFIAYGNIAWVIASLLFLVSGLAEPTVLGTAFVIAQAAAVALFAELQIVGMRRRAAA